MTCATIAAKHVVLSDFCDPTCRQRVIKCPLQKHNPCTEKQTRML